MLENYSLGIYEMAVRMSEHFPLYKAVAAMFRHNPNILPVKRIRSKYYQMTNLLKPTECLI